MRNKIVGDPPKPAKASGVPDPGAAGLVEDRRMRDSGRTMARDCSDSPALPSGFLIRAPDFVIERERHAAGARWVAGVDEAGRGPLAGPVVAAAVILDGSAIPDGLDDSKKLRAEDRERLFGEILATSTVSVASASAAEIDRLNIRQATLLAMSRALAGLSLSACHALVDGRDVPKLWHRRGTAVIEGDARSLSIAAASIVAKVTRDRMMKRLCSAFPVYGFGRHMGYATPQHRAALDLHGPCRFHRQSFSPVRNAPAQRLV